MKKRILFANVHLANDTGSWVRGLGPFGLMKDKVEIVFPPTQPLDWFKDWQYFVDVDCVFLHKPYGHQATGIMNMAKIMGVPLWIDHDDDILKVPPSNPNFGEFQKYSNLKECIEFSYREADFLTVATKCLQKEILDKYKVKAHLIPNGLHDSLLKFKTPFSKNQKVSWRGGPAHMADLIFFKDQIRENMIKFKEAQWFFYGLNAYFLDWFGEVNLKYVGQLGLHDFLMAMCSKNCSVHITPLIKTPFNLNKSNLSWIDGTLAGSACIVPDFEEFKRPGTIKYDSPEGFRDALQQALEGGIDLEAAHNESWDFIRENLLVSKLNLKREEILCGL